MPPLTANEWIVQIPSSPGESAICWWEGGKKKSHFVSYDPVVLSFSWPLLLQSLAIFSILCHLGRDTPGICSTVMLLRKRSIYFSKHMVFEQKKQSTAKVLEDAGWQVCPLTKSTWVAPHPREGPRVWLWHSALLQVEEYSTWNVVNNLKRQSILQIQLAINKCHLL